MSLSIKISKKVGGRSDMIASRSWPQNRISIGRGEECTLVLEDPRKHISRVHVELEEKNEGTFHLTIVSKVNPVFEEATFMGQKAPLIEPDPLEGLELPPIEPGIFDEPAVAEAPWRPPRQSLNARRTYLRKRPT